MTKRQRTLLFSILAIVFIFLATTLILYSQGYRIDWDQGTITQTGGFYFKIQPKSVDIYIDDTLAKKTDFLFGAAFIKNFLPKTYEISVQKEGFHSWRKTLEVLPKTVTETKNVTLIPKDIQFQLLTDDIINFWPAPDNESILLQKQLGQRRWELVVLELKNNIETSLFTQQSSRQSLWNVQWHPNSKTILFQTSSGEQTTSYIQHVTKDQPLCTTYPCVLNFLGAQPGEVSFITSLSDTVLFLQPTNESQLLMQASFGETQALTPISNGVMAFTTKNDLAIWMDNTGMFWQKDITSASPPTELSFNKFPVINETKYSLLTADHRLFVQENNTLFQVYNDRERREILPNVQQISFSPTGEYIALTTSNELWLYTLQTQTSPVQRAQDEVVFLNRFSKPITNLYWFTPAYLIFANEDAIEIAEIDDRDILNTVVFAEFEDPAIFWKGDTSLLYLISQGNLYLSEKILE